MMKKNAQAILEYTILLIIIIASLIIMRYYLRNTLAGKLRDSADSIGQGEVYRPYIGGTKINKDMVENR
ncbi:MAG: hypothetical protein M0Q96_00740 [Candidatus Omnitrophica bacterium]|jgi:hypothetical protein|nr:hypothetical protein [Candidatus Omnitrophota bacterium]